MSKKKATSSEVAEKAGVSQATVSMVLNKKYNVSFSRETVEKVEQAARELGYQLPSRKNKKDKDILSRRLCLHSFPNGPADRTAFWLTAYSFPEVFASVFFISTITPIFLGPSGAGVAKTHKSLSREMAPAGSRRPGGRAGPPLPAKCPNEVRPIHLPARRALRGGLGTRPLQHSHSEKS